MRGRLAVQVVLLGTNHRTAPVEVRERIRFAAKDLERMYEMLREGGEAKESMILSTCNRTEVYLVGEDPARMKAAARKALMEWGRFTAQEIDPYLYCYSGLAAVRHLFEVSAGLDSMIVGEAQILGQVKEAFLAAARCGASGTWVSALARHALECGKAVRTSTGIGRSAASVSYAAVELARKVLGNLRDKVILVLGAGQMGVTTARTLKAHGATCVLVANRTYERALAVAMELGGQAAPFEDLPDLLVRADIVISCTGAPHFVVKAEDVEKAAQTRSGRPLILVDIAVPRDVDPKARGVEGVRIYDIDDLEGVVEFNLARRAEFAREASKIVDERVAAFEAWMAVRDVAPAVCGVRSRIAAIVDAETRRALDEIARIGGLAPEARERVEAVIARATRRIGRKIMHLPTAAIKDAATRPGGFSDVRALCRAFGLPGPSAGRLVDVGGRFKAPASSEVRSPYYPAMLDLSGKSCLVVGGGSVAARKVESLLRCGARVTVVSPKLDPELERLKMQGAIEHIQGAFEGRHARRRFLVVGATDDPEVNRQVAESGLEEKALVNIVDAPELSNFIVPSVVTRGDLCVAVSTAGASPALARAVREKLEGWLDEGFGEYVEAVKQARARILSSDLAAAERRALLLNIADGELVDLAREGRASEAAARVAAMVDAALAARSGEPRAQSAGQGAVRAPAPLAAGKGIGEGKR